MVASQSTYSQGIYGLVSNLGSLVVRTIFQVRSSMTSGVLNSAPSVNTVGKVQVDCARCSQAHRALQKLCQVQESIRQLVKFASCMCSPLRRRLFWRFHSESRGCLKGQPAGSKQMRFPLLCAV